MIQVGARTLLAATCLRCGHLTPGHEFERRKRNPRDRGAYIDKRCRKCRWRRMEESAGR